MTNRSLPAARATPLATQLATAMLGAALLSAFATTKWVTGATQTVRYNGYPAIRISGDAAPGYSTGAAMA
ncbi:MAG TPA: hypothetical protein VN089_17375, partial [Duganella sp.]|nr:hypothetical protein [Duganella sp.]